MTRSLEPIRASVGGVEVVVTPACRKRIRRAARAGLVGIGYLSVIAGATCAAVAIVQSPLVWAVLACAAVAGVIVRRMSV